jgi:hypothetical protein
MLCEYQSLACGAPWRIQSAGNELLLTERSIGLNTSGSTKYWIEQTGVSIEVAARQEEHHLERSKLFDK